MAFFTAREREELDKVNEEGREFVPHQQKNSETDGQLVAKDLAALLQRVAGTSVQEIDHLIFELQELRKKLQNEAARVQSEIMEYATLNQSALESTKIISESLRKSLTTH